VEAGDATKKRKTTQSWNMRNRGKPFLLVEGRGQVNSKRTVGVQGGLKATPRERHVKNGRIEKKGKEWGESRYLWRGKTNKWAHWRGGGHEKKYRDTSN